MINSSIFSRFFIISSIGTGILIFSIVIINWITTEYVIIPNEITKANTIVKSISNDIAVPLQFGLEKDAKYVAHNAIQSNPDIVMIAVKSKEINFAFPQKQDICDGFFVTQAISDQLQYEELGEVSICYAKTDLTKATQTQALIALSICVMIIVVVITLLNSLRKYLKPLSNLSNQLEAFNPIIPININKVKTDNKEIDVIQNAIIKAIDELLAYQSKLENDVANTLQELQAQRQMFENLAKHSLNSILLIDKTIQYSNDAFMRLAGYDKDKLSTVSIFKLFNKYDNVAIYRQAFRLNHKESFAQIFDNAIFTNKNGDKFPVSVSISGVPKDQRLIYIVNITDLSELREKDTMLLAQSRFAAMGEMIANIAHQWRQPLNIIQGSITQAGIFSQMGIFTDDDLQKVVEDIKTQTNYLSSTIDDFRNYYKNDTETEFCVQDAIEKSLALIKSAFGNSFIKNDFISEPEKVYVKGSFNKLIQALISILNNARDAIVAKELDNKIVLVKFESANSSAVISIQDNGDGIDIKNINKIFEPYFTTKAAAQGTGIGLYMTKQIVEQALHGSISVKNSSFEFEGTKYFGAKFIIELPIIK